jgi:hypothetical protein
MKTRFLCECLSALGIVVAIASVCALAFFDVSELPHAFTGLIGIPLGGALLVVVMDLVAQCRQKRTETGTRQSSLPQENGAQRIRSPSQHVTLRGGRRLYRRTDLQHFPPSR